MALKDLNLALTASRIFLASGSLLVCANKEVAIVTAVNNRKQIRFFIVGLNFISILDRLSECQPKGRWSIHPGRKYRLITF